MGNTSIVTETPQRRSQSLKWKWALGSAAGVFLIFILFAWFVVQAFSSQMLKAERRQVETSLSAVESRLSTLTRETLLPATVDKTLQPTGNDFDQLVNDPVLQQLSRSGYTVSVYNKNGGKIYPLDESSMAKFKKIKATSVSYESPSTNGQKILVGRSKLINKANAFIGYVVIEDRLEAYHNTFRRVYLIILILILLGLMLVALWGYWLSEYLLRPVNDIQKVVDLVTNDPQSPERVIILDRREDELTDLAEILNSMLDRMQRFILQQHQFVEDVSHELRTPVAIVKGHMELLNRWGKDDPKILAESIEASLTEMRRMEGLVQEMLDLTRADQVELTFKDGDTDVKEVINSVYQNFVMIHPEFTFGLDDDLIGPTIVNMSRDHLEQILIILSDNAVKYSRDRKEIQFAAATSGPFVELAVQDFGEGIAQEDADRVFDRFYRVDKARSRQQGGNGLGLSIAQKLVEGYGGTIALESAVGRGSVFRITLPIKSRSKS
jgi:signal transduction histidine kinase